MTAGRLSETVFTQHPLRYLVPRQVRTKTGLMKTIKKLRPYFYRNSNFTGLSSMTQLQCPRRRLSTTFVVWYKLNGDTCKTHGLPGKLIRFSPMLTDITPRGSSMHSGYFMAHSHRVPYLFSVQTAQHSSLTKPRSLKDGLNTLKLSSIDPPP